MQTLIGIGLFLTSLFLILLILVQRGRGGGLSGALGGMGGQSAFGTKAGDVFTRITIIVACLWILLSIFSIKMLNSGDSFLPSSLPSNDATTVAPDGDNQESTEPANPSSDTVDNASPATSELETGETSEPAAEPSGEPAAEPSSESGDGEPDSTTTSESP